MANGLMYPTGVSAQPIDIASGGQSFMRATVEAKLAEIKADRVQVSENAKKVLEALSITTIKDMSQKMRTRYQGDIGKYRDDVINTFIESEGKLSLQQQREIQDGFMNLQSRMAGDVNILSKVKEVQDEALANPDMYNMDALVPELRELENNLSEGKYVDDPQTLLLKHMIPQSTSDFVAKNFGNQIKALNQYAIPDYSGDIFSLVKTKGLVPGEANPEVLQLAEDAVRLRDMAMETDFVKSRYMVNGEVDIEAKERERKAIEDTITQAIGEASVKKKGSSGGGSGFQPYVDEIPDVSTFDFGDQEVESKYEKAVSTSAIPSSSYVIPTYNEKGEKTGEKTVKGVVPAVEWHPVAKSEKVFKKKTKQRRAPLGGVVEYQKDNPYNVVSPKAIGNFSSDEIEYKPFIRVLYRENKDNLYGGVESFFEDEGDYETAMVPFDGANRSSLLGRAGSKRQGYEQTIDRTSSAAKTLSKEIQAESMEYEMQEAIKELRKYPQYRNMSDAELRKLIEENQ